MREIEYEPALLDAQTTQSRPAAREPAARYVLTTNDPVVKADRALLAKRGRRRGNGARANTRLCWRVIDVLQTDHHYEPQCHAPID
jgi:hypothetical protein